jgi:nucleoside-diphosphate-sugar epimerase
MLVNPRAFYLLSTRPLLSKDDPFQDTPLASSDLADVMGQVGDAWLELANAKLLMTGCTGFFGAWLVESLLRATKTLGLCTKITLLTRNPGSFERRMPHVANDPAIALEKGDLGHGPLPDDFTHLIHGAATTQGPPVEDQLNALVEGTHRLLNTAIRVKAKRVLFISSGAVYGIQPPELERIPEDHIGNLPSGASYGRSKWQSEALCTRFHQEQNLPVSVARCFAFLAPKLPLNAHFAAGNFLGNALKGEPILVTGDGTPVRSYLYGTDLAAWLWTIFLRGQAGRAYNVGSEHAVTIAQLAQEVAKVARQRVDIVNPTICAERAPRYVPSTRRARIELGLHQTVDLAEAIRRTLRWHRGMPRQ